MSKQKMKDENWIDEVMESMEGKKYVIPSADLYSKIESRIYSDKKTIPLNRVIISIAAAILLLLVNGLLLNQNMKPNNNQSELNSINSEMSLISNFNLYE